MASGNFTLTRTGSTSQYITFTVYWSSSSNGSSANSSTVNIQIIASKSSSSTSDTWGSYNASATVDGSSQSVGDTSFRLSPGNNLTLLSKSYTVSHNSDGTKTTTISASVGGNVMWASGSTSVTLDTIPRKAEITSAPNFNDEENPTIYYNNRAGNSVSTLQTCISFTGSNDDIAYRNISKTGNSYTFNLTENERNVLRNACTNSNSRNVIFYVKTVLSGNTYYSTLTKTLSIVNGNPIFEDNQLSYLDTNSTIVEITENNQDIVRNQSNLEVTYTAAIPKKGASISRYEITFNGNTITKSAADTIDYGTVNLSSNSTLKVKVIDSRGNSTTISKTIQILDWVLPTAIITANRVNNYEDETHLKADVTISSVNNKNAIQSIQYRYKKSEEQNYGSYVSMSNNTQSTLSIDKLYVWDFQIVATDKFGSTTYNFTIAKGMPIMFIDVNKLAVGVNSFPTVNNSLNIAGELMINGNSYNKGYAKMTTDFASKTINSDDTVIDCWKEDISYGCITSDINNNRLVVAQTSCLRLSGQICGDGNAWTRYQIIESISGNEINDHSSLGSLYQLGQIGNGYWSAPMPDTLISLDNTKTYYVYLIVSPYNGVNMRINSGFASRRTYICAEKVN